MNYRQQSNHDGLWWQIALGIFVGQLMTAVVAGLAVLLLGGFAAYQAGQVMTRQVPVINLPAPRQAQPIQRPLGDNERCIQGKRFRRLANGWQELPNAPC
ncbi:MAG TPA: chloride channel protein [Stenotrophomonas sp.]|nr:chloride channel protein [Stenotrophomonas sp.]